MDRPRLLSIVLAAFFTAPSARAETPAEPLMDYVVGRGDTCVSIARKLYGDAKWTELIHANNDLGPKSPHVLKKGQILRLPPHIPTKPAVLAPVRPVEPTGPDAHLTFLRNLVESYTPQKHAGERNESLMHAHRVSTLGSSSAEVTFVDDSRLQLGEHTLVVILGLASSSNEAKSAGSASDTTLVTGSLRAHLAELAGGKTKKPLTLQTPGAAVKLGTGEVQLAVDAKKTTRLAVYRGRSQLRASGHEVEVPQGFGSKADEGRAPTPPKPLPPAPRWTTAPPALVLTDGSPATVTGAYGPGAGEGGLPARYHVQFARDERMNDLLVDTRVPAGTTQLDVKQVPSGLWYARVSAIDADEFEGRSGEIAKVLVAVAKTSRGAAGHLATVDVTPGLYCSLDGGAFGEMKGPLTLTARAHDLKCATTAEGRDAAVAAIPSEQSGPVLVRTEPQPAVRDGAYATREILLFVTDGVGTPIEGASITVPSAPPGVTFSPVKPMGAPGRYALTVRYQPVATAIPMRFVVNGSDEGGAQVPADDEKVVAPRPRRVVGEFAIFGAGRLFQSHSGLGGGAGGGGEGGLRIALGKVGLAFAVRGSVDQYAGDVVQQVASIALPITLRIGTPDWRFTPYVGVLPGVVFQRNIASGLYDTRFGYGGFIGGMVRAGSGGIFLDLGYERALAETNPAGLTFILNGFYALAGYRFTSL